MISFPNVSIGKKQQTTAASSAAAAKVTNGMKTTSSTPQGQTLATAGNPPPTSISQSFTPSTFRRRLLWWAVAIFCIFSILPLTFDDLLLQTADSYNTDGTSMPLKYYAINMPADVMSE